MGDSRRAARAPSTAAATLVVVGAGWIGCEVAASARAAGLDVTIVEPMSVPLERVLGAELGAIYRDVHAEHGVHLRLGSGVEAFEGAGRVERVRTSDGQTIDCSTSSWSASACSRASSSPRRAGLAVGDGVLVDERLRTSAPGVFAAGDVASHAAPVLRRARARRALGQRARPGPGGRARHARQPGALRPPAVLLLRPVRRRDGVRRPRRRRATASCSAATRPAREFIAFWLDGERVVAGHERQRVGRQRAIQALIRSRASVDDGRLADPDVPLESLAGETIS